ncbi:MAG: hypothetical protein ACRDQB_08745 [Thermocrispum sp.]
MPEGGGYDTARDERAYMTVDAIKARIRRETAEAARQQAAIERTAPLLRVRTARRPSPYPRGGRRAAED